MVSQPYDLISSERRHCNLPLNRHVFRSSPIGIRMNVVYLKQISEQSNLPIICNIRLYFFNVHFLHNCERLPRFN